MPPPVVDHLAGAVRVQRDVHFIAVTGHGLVDRVVNHLVDQMVQPRRAGGTDVHARAAPDGLEALQNGDVRRFVRLSPVNHSKRLRPMPVRLGASPRPCHAP